MCIWNMMCQMIKIELWVYSELNLVVGFVTNFRHWQCRSKIIDISHQYQVCNVNLQVGDSSTRVEFIFYLSWNLKQNGFEVKHRSGIYWPCCPLEQFPGQWIPINNDFHCFSSKNQTPLTRSSFFRLVSRWTINVFLFLIGLMLYWTYSSSVFSLPADPCPDIKCTFQPQLPCFFLKSTLSI